MLRESHPVCAFLLFLHHLPERLSSFGSHAFSNSALTSVVIPEGITVLPAYCFADSPSLGNVSLPASLNIIDTYAFYGCTALTELPAIPENASVSIYGYAFSGCTALTTLEIPSTVRRISSYAFSGCTGLEVLSLPAELAEIYYGAFSGCTGLRELTIPIRFDTGDIFLSSVSNVESIHYIAGATGVMTDWNLDSNSSSYYYAARVEYFSRNTLKHVDFAEGITHIGSYAFYGLPALQSATLPRSLTSIGENAFSNTADNMVLYGYSGSYAEAYALSHNLVFIALDAEFTPTVTLPASLIEIEEEAFLGSAFTSIRIPEGTVSIGSRSFADCRQLTQIEIPDSVTFIAPDAFEGIERLIVYCENGSKAADYAEEKGYIIIHP